VPEAVLAGIWALVGASSLVLGAALSITGWIRGRPLAWLIGFGAGALVSAVAYDLVEEAVRASATGLSVAAGFVVGAVVFYVGDELVDRMGDRTGVPILLGAILDGIPESIVLGLSLVGGGTPSLAILVAIFISNVPEAIASSTEMRRGGRTAAWIIGVWAAVAAASGVAAGVGYGLLGSVSGEHIAFINAFAAGAILVMLADELLPEAHSLSADKSVGLATAAGFAVAAALSFTS
jgi:ZIP family zinc transporter